MFKERLSRLSRVARNHWRLIAAIGGVAILAIACSYVFVFADRQPGKASRLDSSPTKHKRVATKKESQPASPTPAALPPAPPSIFAAEPTWQQDFTKMPNGQPDAALWNVSTPDTPIYNDEEQIYTNRAKNLRIENGKLLIEAHREAYGGHAYTSAKIDTKDHFKVRYGKLEARVKVPKGAGTWPAFWMLSNDQVYTARLNPSEADWEQERFYMHDGEIDIMEHTGTHPALVESTTHSFVKSDELSTSLPSATDTFHVYGVEWTPNKIVFTTDGKSYHEVSKTSNSSRQWPFDQYMYIILNLAMGGEMGEKIDPSMNSWRLEVEGIAYYPYIGVE